MAFDVTWKKLDKIPQKPFGGKPDHTKSHVAYSIAQYSADFFDTNITVLHSPNNSEKGIKKLAHCRGSVYSDLFSTKKVTFRAPSSSSD